MVGIQDVAGKTVGVLGVEDVVDGIYDAQLAVINKMAGVHAPDRSTAPPSPRSGPLCLASLPPPPPHTPHHHHHHHHHCDTQGPAPAQCMSGAPVLRTRLGASACPRKGGRCSPHNNDVYRNASCAPQRRGRGISYGAISTALLFLNFG